MFRTKTYGKTFDLFLRSRFIGKKIAVKWTALSLKNVWVTAVFHGNQFKFTNLSIINGFRE